MTSRAPAMEMSACSRGSRFNGFREMKTLSRMREVRNTSRPPTAEAAGSVE